MTQKRLALGDEYRNVASLVNVISKLAIKITFSTLIIHELNHTILAEKQKVSTRNIDQVADVQREYMSANAVLNYEGTIIEI